MAHAAIAFAKASFRRRMMAVTSSIGPGATNMVTAAAVAHVNRLPLLLLPGDVFANRRPDPVLQQIEDFGDGTVSANDCFRPVSRYFDRITRPEQIIPALQPRHGGADRSGRMRAGDAGAVPGRAGRGFRLSRRLLRRAHLDSAPHPSVGGRTRRRDRGAAPGQEAADHRRRRRALFRRQRDIDAFRRSPSAFRSPRRRRASHRCRPTIRSTWARSASPAPRPQTLWPNRPMSSSRWARGCRISRPAPGLCSRTTARPSSASTRSSSMRPSIARFRFVADADAGLEDDRRRRRRLTARPTIG